MKRMMAIATALVMASGTALADDKVSEADGKKIQSTIAAWGCSGGDMEKENEGSGVYEVDDAKCSSGQYDVKLDENFTVIEISRD